jgi:TatA/E family protein of Tat protein translocase
VFGIGGNELLIIGLFALIIFGPDKIPEIARTVGKAWNTFKRAQEDMERVIRAEIYAPDSKLGPDDGPDGSTPGDSGLSSSPATTIWTVDEEDEEEEE